VLQEIYYFKPQAIYVSIVFVTVIGYALGEFMSLIPRIGPVGRFINPFPFNSKERAFIVIMASAAATNAVSTEILAAQTVLQHGSERWRCYLPRHFVPITWIWYCWASSFRSCTTYKVRHVHQR
jgi:hypothetical protein